MTDPLNAVPEPVFPVRRAVEAGLVTSRARRPDLVAAGRGLRRRRDAPVTSVQMAVAHAQGDRSLIVSHASAAALWGLWLPPGRQAPPQLSRLRPAAQPRVAGVEGHRLRLDPAVDLVVLGAAGTAHTVTSPGRTWLDLAAAGLRGEDLVVAGDALLRRADGPRGRLPRAGGTPSRGRTSCGPPSTLWPAAPQAGPCRRRCRTCARGRTRPRRAGCGSDWSGPACPSRR